MALGNIIIVAIIILVTWYICYEFYRPYKLQKEWSTYHTHEHHTSLLKARFYTKYNFDSVYELESVKRKQIEVEIDNIFANKLISLCYGRLEKLLDIWQRRLFGPGRSHLMLQPDECAVALKIKQYLDSATPEDLLKDDKIKAFLSAHSELRMVDRL